MIKISDEMMNKAMQLNIDILAWWHDHLAISMWCGFILGFYCAFTYHDAIIWVYNSIISKIKKVRA